MANKSLGYLIAIIGLISLAASFIKEVNDFFVNTLKLPLNSIPESYLVVLSVIIVAVGIYIVVKSDSRYRHKSIKGKEVPIYHGKEIVGYRRH